MAKNCNVTSIKVGDKKVSSGLITEALKSAKGIKNIDEAIVQSYKVVEKSVDLKAWEKFLTNVREVTPTVKITGAHVTGSLINDRKTNKLVDLLNLKGLEKATLKTKNIVNNTKNKIISEGLLLDEAEVASLTTKIGAAIEVSKRTIKNIETNNRIAKNIRKFENTSLYPLVDELTGISPTVIPSELQEEYENLLNNLSSKKKGDNFKEELRSIKNILKDASPQIRTKKDDEKTRGVRIKKILGSVVRPEKIKNREKRELAKELSDLKDSDLKYLNDEELQGLIYEISNINSGKLGKSTYDVITKIKSEKAVNSTAQPLAKTKLSGWKKPLQNIYGKATSIVTPKTNELNQIIRATPLAHIDMLLGTSGDLIFNKVFRPLARAQSRLDTETRGVDLSSDNAESKQRRANRKNINESKYRTKLYEIQLQHETNNDQYSAAEYVETIKERVKRGDTFYYDEGSVKILEGLEKKFKVKGEFSLSELRKSLNKSELDVVKHNSTLALDQVEKISYLSGVIRGTEIEVLNNNANVKVIEQKQVEEDFRTLTRRFKGLGGSNVDERIRREGKKAPLITLDPVNDARDNAKKVLSEYHLSPEIKIAYQTVEKLKDRILSGEGEPTNAAKLAITSIAVSLDNVIETELSRHHAEYGLIDDVINGLSKAGYLAQLGRIERTAAEATTNFGWALVTRPEQFLKGLANKMTWDKRGAVAMQNLGSIGTERLYDVGVFSGKMVGNTFIEGKRRERDQKNNTALSNIEAIKNHIIENKAVDGIKWISQTVGKVLLAGSDVAMNRPLWWGNFEDEFKNATGVLPDKEKITANDEAYMDENREALDLATKEADKWQVLAGATNNPFADIQKLKSKASNSSVKKAVRTVDAHFMRFLMYENSSLDIASASLVGQGYLTRREAAALKVANYYRMIAYFPLIGVFSYLLYGGEDDEDPVEEFQESVKRDAIGTLVTNNLMGRLGAYGRMPISYGVELLNEKYLAGLRNGEEYDPWKHSIVFSLIDKNDFKYNKSFNDFLINTNAGPAGPFLRDAGKSFDDLKKVVNAKTPEDKSLQFERFATRAAIMAAGHGLKAPFYGNVIREYDKHMRKLRAGEKKNKKKSKDKY